MGFLDFLSRKSANDKSSKSRSQLKSQAYHSVAPAQPPIRGAYPVSGNGPDIMEELQRAARKRSEAQLSIAARSASVLGRRRPASERRPSTGMEDTASVQSLARSLGAAPRMSQYGSHGTLGQRYDIAGVPPVPSIPAEHRGFVDLLDAQCELRPSDFRTRLQASGARDYGEDVADRNLVNYQAGLPSPSLPSMTVRSRPPSSLALSHVGDYDESAPSPKVAQGTHSRSQWSSQHLEVNVEPRKLKRAPSKGSAARIEVNNGRQGNAKQGPLVAEVDASADGLTRPRPLSEHASNSPSKPSRPRPLSLHPTATRTDFGAASPPIVPRYRLETTRQRSRLPVASATSPRPRDSVLVAKMKRQEENDRARRRSSSAAAFPPAVTDLRDEPDRDGAYYTITGLDSSWNADREESGDEGILRTIPSSRDPVRDAASSHSRQTSQNSFLETRPHTRGDASTLPSRPSSSSSAYFSHPRNRSIGGGSIPPRSQLDDISEHIPARTSSLGQSVTSAVTPTTVSSGYSSNAVSLSNHTANTSLDEPPSLPSITSMHARKSSATSSGRPSSSSNYMTAAEDVISLDTLLDERRGGGKNEFEKRQPGAADQDYDTLTTTDGSDVESFVQKTQERSQKAMGETQLLFRDGHYGGIGGGLPGLYDSGNDTSTPRWAGTPTTPTGPFAKSNIPTSQSVRPSPQSNHNRHAQPSYQIKHTKVPAYEYSSSDSFASGDDHDDHEDEADFSTRDFDVSRAQALLTLAALGGADVPGRLDLLRAMLDESRAPAVDGRAALQQRKESKMKERQSRLEKRQGKRVARNEYDEGAVADIEI